MKRFDRTLLYSNQLQSSVFVETQFNRIIAFGKGCVLLVSDFLLLQPKLLLRPKLDINGSNYIGSKTEIDSTRKETHLLKGQFRLKVIMEKRHPAPITSTQVGQKSALVAIAPQEMYKKYKILI